jgi:hypothetical protein
MFWFPQSPERNQKASERVYTAKYADGSFAGKFSSGVLEYVPTKRVAISEYELWTDFVYLHPYWGPPPVQEPDKAWLHLTFGVASQVSSSYRRAPTSGILGLGRRRLDFWRVGVISNVLTHRKRPGQQIDSIARKLLSQLARLTINLKIRRSFSKFDLS